MAAGAYTESIPIGVIVAILGSVVCFLVIRFLENMLGKGIDKATDAVANQFAKRSQKNEPASGNLADRFQASVPSQPTATQAGAFCTKCGAAVKPGSCNLGLIRYADIVIITGNLCNGKILNAYNGAEDFSCPQI